jgi:hypothetical protein
MGAGKLPPFVPSRPRPIIIDGVPIRVQVPVYSSIEPEARPVRVEPAVRREPRPRPPHPFSAPRPKAALTTA